MVTALLWDHDGVLVDTEHLYFQATREALARVGVGLDEDDYRAHFLVSGAGAWHIASARGVAAETIEALKRWRGARYTQLLREGDLLMPGVLEMLEDARRAFRMAIVTSSHRDHFDVIHRRGELPPYFELILTREDYRDAKPSPEPYLLALARLGLPPSDCLVIEDSERGLLAARAAGVRCWVVPSRLTRAQRFEGAERVFDSLAELRTALVEQARTISVRERGCPPLAGESQAPQAPE